MSEKNSRKIVYKIEEGIDPSEVYCTTYQMRNFYKQFADGFFSSLDVMNYIQHHKAVMMMKKGWRVLEVCCGRGLLLPLMRYYKKEVEEYVGVDIEEKNINEQKRRSGVRPIDDLDSYYPFKVTHLICSCEDMDSRLEHNSFDFIVYTSAIEHMQKEVGIHSLQNCWNLMKDGGMMFLSCPNTREKKDPYDTQYAAHLYEWDLEELTAEVEKAGFSIVETFGLVAKVRDFEEFMKERPNEEMLRYQKLKKYLPSQWLMSFFPILYPEAAAEVLLIVQKDNSRTVSKGATSYRSRPEKKSPLPFPGKGKRRRDPRKGGFFDVSSGDKDEGGNSE